jgi:hypothetical protein
MRWKFIRNSKTVGDHKRLRITIWLSLEDSVIYLNLFLRRPSMLTTLRYTGTARLLQPSAENERKRRDSRAPPLRDVFFVCSYLSRTKKRRRKFGASAASIIRAHVLLKNKCRNQPLIVSVEEHKNYTKGGITHTAQPISICDAKI